MEKPQQNTVDTGLIRMFLSMTPEERILANDETVRTILELRHAIKTQKTATDEPERPDQGPQ
ncbi:MAG: hypothetical protein JEZ11_26470 [Desulfobacterales bacterium]|nr:hypothetical protein [Desulfobacterales bacterium]